MVTNFDVKRNNQDNISSNNNFEISVNFTATPYIGSERTNCVVMVPEEAIEENNDMFNSRYNFGPENIYLNYDSNALYDNMKIVFEKYGLNISKEDFIELLNTITKKDITKAYPDTIQNLHHMIEQTLKHMASKKEKITFESFSKQLNIYHTAIHFGWDSVDSFENANKQNSESLKERIARYSDKSIEEITEEDYKKYYESQLSSVDWYTLSGLLKRGRHAWSRWITGSVETNYKDAKHTEALTDFIKLLINSSEEERLEFKNAIKYMENVDGAELIETVFNFLEYPELKQQFAASFTIEDIKTTSNNNNSDNPEKKPLASAEIYEVIAKYLSNDDLVNKEAELSEELRIFLEQNKEILKEIKDKSLDKLSKKEREIYAEYEQLIASQIGYKSGTKGNIYADQETIDLVVAKVDNTLGEVRTENNSTNTIIEQIEKQLNDNTAKENLNNIENPATTEERLNNTPSIGFAQKENVNNNTNVNNNNTEVASTASVIDTPVQTESTSNSSVALGFTATAPKVDTTRLDSISQTITAQTTEAVRAENQAEEVVVTKTTSFIKALQLGKEGVDKFFAENGTIKAVTAVFNNFSQISDQTIITKALQLYKGLSSTEQADILVSAKNGALVELINNSDINALAQCQGETASNFWATKKINEAAEKALEKQA